MTHYLSTLAIALLAFTTFAKDVPAGTKLEQVSVAKIWDVAPHNAFTDLIRFKDRWFCTFRESQAHVGGNGKIRVLSSVDGDHWQSAALLEEDGIDLRDPKLSIAPDGQLMLVLGGSVYDGKKLLERQSRVAFSKNGKDWSTPQRVLAKGDWLWRVTWHDGIAYGLAYNSSVKDWELKLVSSKDGTSFHLLKKLDVDGQPNEATLRFDKQGRAVILARREANDKQAWIGTALAPYTEWKWTPAGMQIGGPNFIQLPNGRWIASGRKYNGPKVTEHAAFVGTMTTTSVSPDLVLPSGGDCSYPGLVWYNDILWATYYSSHEGKTAIYLAKVKVSGK
jgi:hypothetical protein